MHRRKIPGIEALLAFEAAARHQSFTRAADELALTQSAVGRQIVLLEEFLGGPLFNRVKQRVCLTDTGEAYARAIRDDLDRLEKHTLEAMEARAPCDRLAIAVTPTFATRWLIPRLPRFNARHREVTVNVASCGERLLYADAPWENTDAAIGFGQPSQPGMVTEFLFGEEMVVVCSPALRQHSAPLPAQDLRKYPLLHSSTRPDAWHRWFHRAGLRNAGSTSGPQYELFSMLVEAARAGIGVALVPRFLIAPELEQGTLVILAEPPLRSEKGYYFVHPECRQCSSALHAFKQWLVLEASHERRFTHLT